MKENNAFLIVKRIQCIFMLLLYVSGVSRFLGNGIFSLAYLLLMFVVVIIMFPDICKEGKGFKEKPKTLLLIPIGILLVILLDSLYGFSYMCFRACIGGNSVSLYVIWPDQ